MPGTPLTTNAAFGQILADMGAVGVGEIENRDGQEDVTMDSIGGFFGEMPQEPTLLEFAEEGVLDQAAQVIQIDDRQRVIHRQTGKEDLGFVVGINLVIKLSDDNGVDGVAFEVSTIAELLMFLVAILVVGS